MKISKIVSGGQTGSDVAGLKAAFQYGIETGGWAPKDYRTDDGNDYSLKRYGLKCTESEAYPPRTELNVQECDVTIIFGNENSPGCRLTKRLCKKHKKPFFVVANFSQDDMSMVYHELQKLDDDLILNVAGNREKSNVGIEAKTKKFLLKLFQYLDDK